MQHKQNVYLSQLETLTPKASGIHLKRPHLPFVTETNRISHGEKNDIFCKRSNHNPGQRIGYRFRRSAGLSMSSKPVSIDLTQIAPPQIQREHAT